ncbi:MAG: serine/threonine-protein kinase, partial [Planctomycetota bacterium]
MSIDSDKSSGWDSDETRDLPEDAIEQREESSGNLTTQLSISRYLVLRQLGEGGFGSVFLAQDPVLKREVAIKIPRVGSNLSSASVEKFLKEGQMLARANHPSIVSVYDVGTTDDGIPFVVMEFVQGTSLSQRMKESRGQKFDLKDCLKTLVRIAEGLLQAHKNGLVHRDLKPSNIIINADGDICLVDFGLALHDDLSADEWEDRSIVGTPQYMAPEQIRG